MLAFEGDARVTTTTKTGKKTITTTTDTPIQVFIANADGSGVFQVTSTSIGSAQPAWSPDGSSLAFASNSGIYSTVLGSGVFNFLHARRPARLESVNMNKPRMKLGFVVLTFCRHVVALGQDPTILATSLSGTNLVFSGSNVQSARNLLARPRASRFTFLILLAGWLALRVTQAADLAATNRPPAIPWNQIGAKAGASYQGDGLAVTLTGSSAHLHCVFQRLDGEAATEGLWLTSTVINTVSDRFRVTAMEVGRKRATDIFDFQFQNPTAHWRMRAKYPSGARRRVSAAPG